MNNHPTSKQIIIAICGKSATGKDTFAKWLYKDMKYRGYDVTNIVSHTTRSKRVNEVAGIDYEFLTDKEFILNALNKEYLEYTKFKGWRYGTPRSSIAAHINIGVFNVQGLISLANHQDKYLIIPIYLKDRMWLRIKRSIDRENKFKLEFIRRLLVDWKDFRNIRYILGKFPHYLTLENINGIIRKTQMFYRRCGKFLGNFL